MRAGRFGRLSHFASRKKQILSDCPPAAQPLCGGYACQLLNLWSNDCRAWARIVVVRHLGIAGNLPSIGKDDGAAMRDQWQAWIETEAAMNAGYLLLG